MDRPDIPVYLMTGFLEGGKTTFINDTFKDPGFLAGGNILFICCEEGEVEFDTSVVDNKRIFMEVIDDEEDMTEEKFDEFELKYKPEKIIIEYNGMWLLNDLFESTPENWCLVQNFLFIDAGSIMMYNANLRTLVFDKLQVADFIVFNRVGADMDTYEFHKLVRAVSTNADIAYETMDGVVHYDEYEDPLPFDKESDFIEIEDKDYAMFYRDLANNTNDYKGKTVSFTALTSKPDWAHSDEMLVGRHIMTCCIEDTRYGGMICTYPQADLFEHHDWVKVTGRIKITKHRWYKNPGPVLVADCIENCSPPAEKIATFY